ncbi:MAG: S24 family peptidase, partial [Polyangiaceae bacterium]|nr:S24 family peptidase [Polyangiaceae bacterium]
ETAGDPRYPLSLLLRVITVSLETIKIVNSLPKLDIFALDDEEPSGRKVVPFRRVTPKAEERYKNCVPLVALQAAAGGWSDVQEGIVELGDPEVDWVVPETDARLEKGMFVAQVCGRSMEPLISDGAYCLFRRVVLPSSPERAVLVRCAGMVDPETGGQFTVKRYREETGADGGKVVVLWSVNAEFAPLVVSEGDRVCVIGEVVAVLAG